MKKLSLILLLIVYGLSSTGMTLNFHYCCGKLKKVEFSTVPVECGMKAYHGDNKKCCDKNQVELKVKADQKITEAEKNAFKTTTITSSFSDLSFSHLANDKYLVPSIFAPPPLYKHHLYILHCIYRI